MTIPVFITARLGSTRLPRKHLLKLGQYTVIEHVYLRCKHFGFAPTVCIPETEQGSWLAAVPTIKCESGHPDNVEHRLLEIAERLGTRKFHHLDGDDPFFDEEAIEMMWELDGKKIIASPLSQTGSALMGATYNLDSLVDVRITDNPRCHPWPQRLTLDYEEDYHLLAAVNRMVGGYMAPRWAVDDLFVRNPDLHKINWFRTDEWKARQLQEQTK